MNGQDDHTSGSARYARPQLLPRLGTLAAVNLVAGALSRSPIAMCGVILLSTGYLAIVILKTRDVMRHVGGLHPTDRWLCRWSGVLASALAASLFAGVNILVGDDMDPSDVGLESSWGMVLVGFIMEIGVVLSVACLWAPRNLGHARPVILWKIMAGPLLMVYGLYVVLLMITPAASRLTEP